MSSSQQRRNVTLKDISKATGYSITAVSHALKDMPDISETTKQQIKKYAAQLGYIGNSSASSLRTGRSKTIAVILGDVANPYFSYIAKEIQQTVSKSGYSVFFVSTNESHTTERDAILMACGKNIDGILICPAQTPMNDENVRFIINANIPCVLIGRRFNGLPVSYVISDDKKAGYLIGRHVVTYGHKNILYINTPKMNASSDDRLEGFYSAIREVNDDITVKNILFDDHGAYFHTLLNHNGAFQYTAAVCYNDIIAWDVLYHMNKMGKKVPEDLSVAAFDNLHAYLPLPFPLTSVSSPKHTIPHNAIKILLQQIENPASSLTQIVLDVKLYDRKSVKNLSAEQKNVAANG